MNKENALKPGAKALGICLLSFAIVILVWVSFTMIVGLYELTSGIVYEIARVAAACVFPVMTAICGVLLYSTVKAPVDRGKNQD